MCEYSIHWFVPWSSDKPFASESCGCSGGLRASTSRSILIKLLFVSKDIHLSILTMPRKALLFPLIKTLVWHAQTTEHDPTWMSMEGMFWSSCPGMRPIILGYFLPTITMEIETFPFQIGLRHVLNWPKLILDPKFHDAGGLFFWWLRKTNTQDSCFIRMY